jgi:hypothetical protein
VGERIDAKTELHRAERAVRGELPEETVLLNVDTGKAVRLNATGAWCWERLSAPSSVGDLAAGLAQEFVVEPERALEDVSGFASELLGRGLLEAGS